MAEDAKCNVLIPNFAPRAAVRDIISNTQVLTVRFGGQPTYCLTQILTGRVVSQRDLYKNDKAQSKTCILCTAGPEDTAHHGLSYIREGYMTEETGIHIFNYSVAKVTETREDLDLLSRRY